MKKILVVEDEKALSSVLRDELLLHKYDVAVAYDGEEGMEQMKKKRPDLVLLDLLLPKMDGFEVLKEMKADDDLKDVPVVVLSNLGQDEDIKLALKLGANDYLVKTQHPIKEVIQKIQHYLVQGKT